MQTLPSLQLSALPAVHTPAWHVSAPLHTLRSRHGVPLSTGVCRQPKTASHVSVLQTLPSSQLSGVPAAQAPAWQVSLPLHTLPSLHEVPFRTGALTQPATASQLSAVQTLPSLQLSAVPGVHTPFWQVSLPLQTLPSGQAIPLATGTFWQPTTGWQLSVVHTVPSLQLSATPGVHTPAWQVSPPLHTLPSAHDAPFGSALYRQPSSGSQVSLVHTLPSAQLRAVPAVHTPARHVSSPLQRFPSAHAEPSERTGLLQTPAVQTSFVHGLPSAQSEPIVQIWHPGMGVWMQPVMVSHVSTVQPLVSLQLRAVPEVQVPPWQVSAPLHTLPSVHGVPLRTGVLAQPKTGSQVSVVQTLESLQLRTVPAVQVPPWQVSLPLQTLPSAQVVPFTTGVFTQPETGLQVSVVHTFESLQLSGVPAVQTPLWQRSLPLQTFPSPQEVPFSTDVFTQPASGSQLSVVQTLESLQLRGVPAVQTPS